jgi:hypothetical protein
MRGDDNRAPRYGKPRGVEQHTFGYIRNAAREEWRPIPRFPGYEISRNLRVRRRSTGKILRPWFVRGYPAVSLRRGGRTHKKLIGRLFAIAFLGLRANREFDHRRMRASTRREIIRACPGKRNHSSCYKGVSRTRDGRWFSCIKLSARTRAIGLFDRERDAAPAYDAAARKSWGPAAYQNFCEVST